MKNYLNKSYENLLQAEDKCFSVPLFLDDNNYYENSPMHKQQMLLGNKWIDNNHILSILQDSHVNNDVQMTTTIGENKICPSHRSFIKNLCH